MIDGYINEKILHCLSDCRLHTYQEIADEIEAHRNTVIKHIKYLSLLYKIISYHGGKEKGVKLLRSRTVFLTDSEKTKVVEALEKLNDLNLQSLIDKFKVK